MVHPTFPGSGRVSRTVAALAATAAGLGLTGAAVVALTGPAAPGRLLRLRVAASPHPGGEGKQVRDVAAPSSRSLPGRPPVPAAPPVAPLRRLVAPDLLLTLSRSATPAMLRTLARTPGVTAVTTLDLGWARTPAGMLRVAGVDPSTFRAFTPRLSATADRLWESVARGEVTVAFARSPAYAGRLGTPLPLAHGRTLVARLGAFATIGVPGVDALVSQRLAHDLGLTPRSGVLVAAPRLSLPDLRAAVQRALGRPQAVHTLRPVAVNQNLVSSYATATIPPAYLRLYQAAAQTCTGLPWTVLAAIGAVETGHGADTRVSSAGAMGPMQFLPSTWALYGYDANHDGTANIMDPVDAVYSAARYLCLNGAGRGGQALYDAIFAYNHADWYVREVAALAVAYQ